MSKYPFLPSDLIYNRTNFRDKNKYKGVTRQEAGSIISHTKEYENCHTVYPRQRLKSKNYIQKAKLKINGPMVLPHKSTIFFQNMNLSKFLIDSKILLD